MQAYWAIDQAAIFDGLGVRECCLHLNKLDQGCLHLNLNLDQIVVTSWERFIILQWVLMLYRHRNNVVLLIVRNVHCRDHRQLTADVFCHFNLEDLSGWTDSQSLIVEWEPQYFFLLTQRGRLGYCRVKNCCCDLANRHDRLHVGARPIVACSLSRHAWCHRERGARNKLPKQER